MYQNRQLDLICDEDRSTSDYLIAKLEDTRRDFMKKVGSTILGSNYSLNAIEVSETESLAPEEKGKRPRLVIYELSGKNQDYLSINYDLDHFDDEFFWFKIPLPAFERIDTPVAEAVRKFNDKSFEVKQKYLEEEYAKQEAQLKSWMPEEHIEPAVYENWVKPQARMHAETRMFEDFFPEDPENIADELSKLEASAKNMMDYWNEEDEEFKFSQNIEEWLGTTW